MNGWRVVSSSLSFTAGNAVGDIDDDGEEEIIVSSSEGKVLIFDKDGDLIKDIKTLSESPSYLTLSDVNRDGSLDIIVTGYSLDCVSSFCGLEVYNSDGALLDGWPVEIRSQNFVLGSPVVGDVNRDGHPEMVLVYSQLEPGVEDEIIIFDYKGVKINTISGEDFSIYSLLANADEDENL